MAHSAVVAYLRQHRERYPLTALRQQLATNGYPAAVIEAGVREVFGRAALHSGSVAPRTFDFRHPYPYHTVGQKVGHFLLGLVFLWVVAFVTIVTPWVLDYEWRGVIILGSLALRVGILIVLFRVRRWMFWGWLTGVLGWYIWGDLAGLYGGIFYYLW